MQFLAVGLNITWNEHVRVTSVKLIKLAK